MSITLTILGEPRTLSAEELEPETSPHTGKALRHLQVSATAAPELDDELRKALQAAREPDAALEADDGTRWVVVGSSSSYTSGGGPSHHSFELREAELLNPESLSFLGLSIKPLRYHEEADSDGQITIKLRCNLNEGDSARFEEVVAAAVSDDAEPYFEVVRHGVEDTPLRARFGRCFWEPQDDGRAHLIHLVSEHGDTSKFRGWSEPELGNLKRLATATSDIVEALLDELTAAGALDGEAAARVRQHGADALLRRWREFDRVSDIDAWWH